MGALHLVLEMWDRAGTPTMLTMSGQRERATAHAPQALLPERQVPVGQFRL
jgi:hypothetical protein